MMKDDDFVVACYFSVIHCILLFESLMSGKVDESAEFGLKA